MCVRRFAPWQPRAVKFLSLKTSPEQNSSAWETRPALQATDKSAVATRDPWQSVELGWQQITGVLAARHPSLAPFFTVAASEGDQQRCATPKIFKPLGTVWNQNGCRPDDHLQEIFKVLLVPRRSS